MKPWIEITDRSIVVETQHITITVHVKAEQAAEETAPGVNFNYNRTAIMDSPIVIKDPIPVEPPANCPKPTTAPKQKPVYKTCKLCGTDYRAKGNAQVYCDECKVIISPKPRTKKKVLSEMEEAELDKTLEEIERKRHTYQIL